MRKKSTVLFHNNWRVSSTGHLYRAHLGLDRISSSLDLPYCNSFKYRALGSGGDLALSCLSVYGDNRSGHRYYKLEKKARVAQKPLSGSFSLAPLHQSCHRSTHVDLVI